MSGAPEVVVKEAYLQDEDAVRDIRISDGRIDRIAPELDSTDALVIHAEGNLVSPGFVDAHVHLDQALSRTGQRKPTDNDDPFRRSRSLRLAKEHFAATSADRITETVVDVCRNAVANGVLHVRTHAYVDCDVETKAVSAIDAARQQLDGLLDIEIVAFPQQGVYHPGSERMLKASVDRGADLVGGLDPASINRDVEGTLETWFDVASTVDVDLDVHLHDDGTLGLYTFERLLDWTERYEYAGRVTASHSYALADLASVTDESWVSDGSAERLLARFRDADLKFVTCYLSTPPAMPIARVQDAGLSLGHGSDQVRDMWSAHGNMNPLEEALAQSMRLTTDDYSTNENLGRIWRMMTHGGAAVLGIDDVYGIAEGQPADLVVHDSRSRQWAIVEQSTPRAVLKDGAVVARGGELVDD